MGELGWAKILASNHFGNSGNTGFVFIQEETESCDSPKVDVN